MKSISTGHFYGIIVNKLKQRQYPLCGQIELTYRCDLNCIHCYCKGSEDKDRELTTKEWKKILDEIHKEGCINLVFTGGDPLARRDFLELYAYAKHKGFIITLFTNGQRFSNEIVDYLMKSPPYSIEITVNGITKDVYEAITQVKNSFENAIKIINLLAKVKLPLKLKSNCLKQNKDEIGKIKAFAEGLLGKPIDNKHQYGYDTMIYPRLNGDRTPCNYRLSFEEMEKLRKQDLDTWQDYQKSLHRGSPGLKRDGSFLYHCSSWMQQFFIDPYGSLKLCTVSEKFSVDLRTTSFKEGFYKIFPKVLKQKFKTDSKCQNCTLRPICCWCPARAYLEMGDEEAPVLYYCELSKLWQRKSKRVNLTFINKMKRERRVGCPKKQNLNP